MDRLNRLAAAGFAALLLATSVAAEPEGYYEQEPTTGAAAAEVGKAFAHLAIAAGYLGVKAGYAAGGFALGTVAWAFSGADGYVFKAIAKPAVYGDYLLTRRQAFFQDDFTFFGGRPGSTPRARVAEEKPLTQPKPRFEWKRDDAPAKEPPRSFSF